MGRLGLVVGALGVAACAPITTHTHVDEHINGKHDKISAPIRSETVATIDAGQAELAVQISDRDTCTTHEIETVGRVQRRSRSVNKPVLVLEYGLGIILGGAGGFALADPDDTVTAVNQVTPTTRANMVLAGEGAAGLGGLLLLSAIINSTRGGDSSTTLPDEDREVGTPRETACGEHAIAARTVIVVADARTGVLPPTDAAGRTAATWDALSATLFEGGRTARARRPASRRRGGTCRRSRRARAGAAGADRSRVEGDGDRRHRARGRRVRGSVPGLARCRRRREDRRGRRSRDGCARGRRDRSRRFRGRACAAAGVDRARADLEPANRARDRARRSRARREDRRASSPRSTASSPPPATPPTSRRSRARWHSSTSSSRWRRTMCERRSNRRGSRRPAPRAKPSCCSARRTPRRRTSSPTRCRWRRWPSR